MPNGGKGQAVIALVVAFAVVLPMTSQAAEFHIAPQGSDTNPGTKLEPFATLLRAQDVVRRLDRREPVDIILREGTYYLPDPLILGPEDSGAKDAPVTWRSAEGQKATLSGGVRITGAWKQADGGIWSVAVPGVSKGWNFRQLFVEGKRAIRARYPNANGPNPFLYAKDGGMDHILVETELVKASWGTEPDAQVNMVPDWKFFNQWNTVTGANPSTGRIDIADSERHGAIKTGNWFWIEGVKGELDQPGEWYLDQTEGRLYYMPEPGVDPNTLDVVAPRLNVIVYAKGDVEKRTHVEHLQFRNLAFRHTSFSLGHIEARVHTDAAIRLENANHFRISDCHFENIGGYALWLHLDCQDNAFDHNTVQDSGGGGVLFTGARFSYMDDSKLFTPGDVAATVFPILNRVTHNTVEHCGRIRYYGGGVHLDSRPACMAMSSGNYIAHNHFQDLSRNGIFAFRNQGGNVVEYNHIHDCMQTTIDGACIHFATMNRLNAPNFILNNWLYDIWGYEQKPDGRPKRHLANGVFLDWDTSNTTVKHNYIYNAGGQPVKTIWQNWGLSVADNHSADERIEPPFLDEVGPDGTATHGIRPADLGRTGRVVHYTDKDFVSVEGNWQAKIVDGKNGLFRFSFLEARPDRPAKATFRLPINEPGSYLLCLCYKPDKNNASNARLKVTHAEGEDNRTWDLSQGNEHGFAVEVGTYCFEPKEAAFVTISNDGADGSIVADSVAFVKTQE